MRGLRSILVAAVLLLCFIPCAVTTHAQPTASYELYLESYLSVTSAETGVWQSSSASSEGGSLVSYGLELADGASNKFIRLANFNGLRFSTFTTANVKLAYGEQWGDTVTVSFNYRLSEGSEYYAEDDKVLTLSIGGVEKHLTVKELAVSSQSGVDWSSASVTISVGANKADRLTLKYYYDGNIAWRTNQRYLDVDNVVAISGTANLCNVNLENAPITTANKKELSIDYASIAPQSKQSYLLHGKDAVDYANNTVYVREERVSFDGGDVAVALPKAGSFLYRGAASVKANESDLYLIYDASDENSYLRMGNYNGLASATSTRFTMAFYDNDSNQISNMPVTNRINFSFDYRLYMSEAVESSLDFSKNILQFSTRSSSGNNSGNISFDELVVNEDGDGTWHTFNGILDVYTTTTETIAVYYFAYQQASFTPEVYLDMDNITLQAEGSNVNYAYLNGTFEGAVPTVSDGSDPLNGKVYCNPLLGTKGEKVRVGSVDYAMQLEKGDSLSLDLGWKPTTNVYNICFDVKEKVGVFKLFISGRSGDCLELTVGENAVADNGAYEVYWESLSEGYKCHIFFIRTAPNALYSIDFINSGLSALTLNNLFVGEVSSVCSVAGDFTAFTESFNALVSSYEANANSYTSNAKMQVKRAIYNASLINGYSSQANMDAAILALTSAVNNGAKLADLSKLELALEKAEAIYQGGGAKKYTRASWLLFDQADKAARALNGESSQEAVDAAAEKLEMAIKELALVEDNGSSVVLAIGVGGGALGLGGVALCSIMIKRRKKNEKN